ncbi:putative disease resistance protein RGA3 isoform X2 [Salvia hispanica]|nr:putative disease resistance protein RGA3 isoform X2 [Salvia hispanica]
MGGMGKTTLTRKVFNHERVKARFGSLIWVHVSQTFDAISLFNKILYKVTKKASDGVENSDDILEKTQKALKARVESRDDILEKLQEALKGKTYLLVLDDVWNDDVSKWEGFINSVLGVTSTKGNGIIVTTRSENVASIVNPFHIHHLNGLSDEDCWSIIKVKTFDENGEVPSRLEMIGRKIAKRCQGMPLAANVVGGVLRGKPEEEWSFINENWFSDAKGGENISKILKLSYDHLSSPWLKKCFTFCSIFPKGREIKKEELIELWMGEEFLQPSRRNYMEFVGNMFFNVLLQNSLLQVQWKDIYGNVLYCVMHDLVHDLASSILANNADGSIVIRYKFLEEESSPIPKNVAKHLRTLFLKGGIPGTILSNFQCLHNLTLSGDYKELPNSIRELVHLRNLNIDGTQIVNMPKWIGKFHHLQTLRACWELKNVPSTLKYMFNLRHLHIYSHTKLPAEIGRLTSLRTLPYFTVGKEKGFQIEELGSLKNLKGSLEIQDLEMVLDKEEAMKADIFQKLNLFDLAFTWSDGREDETNDESVLEGLQPHSNLKKLKISRFKGIRFPTWAEKMAVRDGPQGSWVPLDNLIEIKLIGCSEIEEIPRLEHLLNLKSLSLKGLKKVRLINECFNHLMSLEIKELDRLECLPEWLFLNNQNLSILEITNCGVLRELPDGLDTLNSLLLLYIRDCENLKSIGNPSGGARQSQGILRALIIENCRELVELPCEMLESWTSTIDEIVLEGLRSLKNLPMLIDCLAKSFTRLTYLKILGVPKLMAASIGSVESWDLSSLRALLIDVSVEWSIEDSVGIAETVERMLRGCCNSLASCNKLKRLPYVDALNHLTKLESIYISDCPELCIDSEWRNHHPHLEVEVDGQPI